MRNKKVQSSDSLLTRPNLLDALPSLVWISQADGQCIYFNESWLRFTGRTLAQELGDGWAEAVHPDDRAPCLTRIETHLALKTPFKLEYRLRRHDGAYRWVLDHGTPLIGPCGTFVGFLGVCLDVTEQKAEQQSLALELADQMMSINQRMLASVTHDLHQPLMSAQLLVHRLTINAKSADDHDLAHRLQLSLESLRGMLDELMDMSRGGGDERMSMREPVDLGALVARAAAIFEPVAAAKGLRLAAYVSPMVVVSNARMLERVVHNLLDNAVKYTQRGRIIAAARPAGSHARLIVCDTGCGIPQDRLDDAFTAFCRLDHEMGGHGLGLYVVRTMCDRLDHDLRVISTPGQGSRFEIRLPRIRAQAYGDADKAIA